MRLAIYRQIALCLFLLGGGIGAFAQNRIDLVHRQFLERLCLAAKQGEMAGKPMPTFMQEEKIALLEGDFGTLDSLSRDSSARMDIVLSDGKRYAVSFYSGEERVVTISYPVDYQLILGVGMMEAEDNLPLAVMNTAMPSVSDEKVDTCLLKQDATHTYYVLKGDYFELPQLNADRYYVRDVNGAFSLMHSRDFPTQTMANMVTGVEDVCDVTLNILQVKYGYRTERFIIPLRQWVVFCQNEGCTPYYGVIDVSHDTVISELVMQNVALGYAHVMKMTFNPVILEACEGEISARLNSYVPLSNVKSLFYEY